MICNPVSWQNSIHNLGYWSIKLRLHLVGGTLLTLPVWFHLPGGRSHSLWVIYTYVKTDSSPLSNTGLPHTDCTSTVICWIQTAIRHVLYEVDVFVEGFKETKDGHLLCAAGLPGWSRNPPSTLPARSLDLPSGPSLGSLNFFEEDSASSVREDVWSPKFLGAQRWRGEGCGRLGCRPLTNPHV